MSVDRETLDRAVEATSGTMNEERESLALIGKVTRGMEPDQVRGIGELIDRATEAAVKAERERIGGRLLTGIEATAVVMTANDRAYEARIKRNPKLNSHPLSGAPSHSAAELLSALERMGYGLVSLAALGEGDNNKEASE